MSGTDYVFQLNVKLGVGYDAHLLNVTGFDKATFEDNLKWTTENAAGIVATAAALEAAYAVKPLAAGTASVQVTTQAPQQAQQAYQQPAQQAQQQNTAPAPSCAHGPMRFKAAGISKAGNQYNAFWACTADRANQCKSVNA